MWVQSLDQEDLLEKEMATHSSVLAWRIPGMAEPGGRETGLILRFAGKSGNPFQTKQGNQPSCRHQEGRRGSAEAVLGTSVDRKSTV